MELLVKGAGQIGLTLTNPQLELFHRYYQELTEWNRRLNLTAIVGWEEVQLKHFLDSLTVSTVIPQEVRSGGRVIDVGSGGGFPGIPLKIIHPGLTLVLLDSVAKKTAFLRHLVGVLGLEGVEVYTGRAEELGHSPALRESFDVALSRGLAPMRTLVELTLPFCKVGGILVAPKKGDVEGELAEASHALEVLGGRPREVRPVHLDGLRDGRVLLVVEKVRPTPPRFPRRPGMPEKRPL